MKDFTVASTTDSQEDVNLAAGIEPEEKPVETTASEASETPEPESVSATETEEEEAPKPKTNGKGRFEKRISQLTREKFEARAEADSLREQLQQLQQQRQQPPEKPEAVPSPQVPEGRPQRVNFKSDEDYVEAVSQWKAEQVFRAMQQRENENAIRERDTQVHASYLQMADDYTASHPDFNQVIGAIRVSEDVAPGVQAAIMGRPNGPEVAYYLGQHPEVCEELSQMNAADAVAEIGAISISLVPRAPKTNVPRTPATINPVAGGSTRTARDPYGSDMTYDEWRQYRGDGPAGSGLYRRGRR